MSIGLHDKTITHRELHAKHTKRYFSRCTPAYLNENNSDRSLIPQWRCKINRNFQLISSKSDHNHQGTLSRATYCANSKNAQNSFCSPPKRSLSAFSRSDRWSQNGIKSNQEFVRTCPRFYTHRCQRNKNNNDKQTKLGGLYKQRIHQNRGHVPSVVTSALSFFVYRFLSIDINIVIAAHCCHSRDSPFSEAELTSAKQHRMGREGRGMHRYNV